MCGFHLLVDSFNRNAESLKLLGLSDYEVKVYMTLLGSGPTNYRVLVRESGVPTGKIYQIIYGLESKGFLEVFQEKTKLFKAAEPKKALRRRLRQIEDDYLDLEQKTKEILQDLQLKYNQKTDAVQGVVSEIQIGENSTANLVRESLLRAEDEVLISSGELIIRLCLGELVKDLVSKGVQVSALCSTFPVPANVISEGFHNGLANFGVDTRMLKSNLTKYFIVDNRRVMLILGEVEETCIQIEGAALCNVLRESFKEAWEKTKIINYTNRVNHTMNSKINVETSPLTPLL